MNATRKFVLAAAILTTAVMLVTPAGAATTAWTNAHLTKAVTALRTYVRADRARDTRQAHRLTALEAKAAAQAKLAGGIIDPAKTATLPAGSLACPTGGYTFGLRSGAVFTVCNGAAGPKGDRGETGTVNAAPVLICTVKGFRGTHLASGSVCQRQPDRMTVYMPVR